MLKRIRAQQDRLRCAAAGALCDVGVHAWPYLARNNERVAPATSPSCSVSACVGGPFRQTPRRLALTTVDGAATPAMAANLHVRTWNESPNWCNLCKEPINSWNEHRGKREHICLELFYGRIVGSEVRQWDPLSALRWERYFRGRANVAFGAFADHFEATYDGDRRAEILALTKYLIDANILFVGRKFQSSIFAKQPVGFFGAVLMYKAHFPPIVAMFPSADAKEISCLTQMVSGQYNLESVYDLCGFRHLLSPAELSARSGVDQSTHAAQNHSTNAGVGARGGGNPAAINSADASEEEEGYDEEAAAADAEFAAYLSNTTPTHLLTPMRRDAFPDMTFGQKSAFVRLLLGQLRWAVEEDSVACPHPIRPPPHIVVLCQRLVGLIATEMLTTRVTEYVARVEGVWREQYAPTAAVPPPQASLPPLPATNAGILAYYAHSLHSTDYAAMLRSDPTRLQRGTMYFLTDLQRGKRRQLGASSDIEASNAANGGNSGKS